ncbi:MAG TPA: hypothetical protein VEL03_02755 [Streptosporangiaceae bacterium]|nr:hypothetical protein [Streptosporangiaceae bacterium]
MGGRAAVLAESASNVWIVSNGKALHWDGSRWSQIANADGPAVGPLAPYRAHGLWVGAYSLWTGSSWLTLLPTSGGYAAFGNGLAQIPGTGGEAWMVGDTHLGAVIMRSAG